MISENACISFYLNHKTLSKKVIAKHFIDEGIPKPTVYAILQRMENNLTAERKLRIAPSHCKMTKKKIKRLKT